MVVGGWTGRNTIVRELAEGPARWESKVRIEGEGQVSAVRK